MIHYEHLGFLGALIQVKGTVIQLALPHVVCNIIACIFYVWLLDVKSVEVAGVPGGMDRFAWQVLMFPLGFLLVLRSNQAYGRYDEGIKLYVRMVCAANQLVRQLSFITLAEDGKTRLPVPIAGEFPKEGQSTCDDPAQRTIIRHCIAFMAAVRQDLRLTRMDAAEDVKNLALHVNKKELQYLVGVGVQNRETNTPFVIARWLTQDVAAIIHRIPNAPIAARLEGSINEMVSAYEGIWDISTHPVPWPYTHLAQILLILWLYTVPLALVPLYHWWTVAIGPFLTLILVGLDSVARVLQDPFGFDNNDLNIVSDSPVSISSKHTLKLLSYPDLTRARIVAVWV